MDKSLYLEKNISQQPAIDLLRSMGYTYISPEDCEVSRYHVLLKDILRGQLRRLNRYAFAGAENEFSAANIERAMDDLDEPLTDGLVRSGEKIYDALLLGKSYPETVGEGKTLSFNLKYIDWEHSENNLFHVTEEFTVDSRDKLHNARPDIVLFINGIPFAVIECKTPQISVEQAVEQNIRNQQKEYIPQLYKFAQIVMATNKNAVKYATTGTPKKFWNVWKEQNTAFLEGALAQYVTEFERVEMVSDFGWFTPLYRTTTLDSEPGQQVSLFSLYPNGRISVSGLRYPIEKRRLLYWWEATLNEATGKEFYGILEEHARVLVYRTFSSL